jgi:hypothetical protein
VRDHPPDAREALRTYTIKKALADITVLSKAILHIPEDEIPALRVVCSGRQRHLRRRPTVEASRLSMCFTVLRHTRSHSRNTTGSAMA